MTESCPPVSVAGGETTEITLRLPPVKEAGLLFVYPTPRDARGRIMNIVPPYEDSMELEPGKYHVRVDKPGYETTDQWVELKAGEKLDVTIELSRKGTSTVTPSSSPSSSAGTPRPGETWTDQMTGMEFVWVPGGCYEMGSNDGDSEEKPVHEVCVDGFWMGKSDD